MGVGWQQGQMGTLQPWRRCGCHCLWMVGTQGRGGSVSHFGFRGSIPAAVCPLPMGLTHRGLPSQTRPTDTHPEGAGSTSPSGTWFPPSGEPSRPNSAPSALPLLIPFSPAAHLRQILSFHCVTFTSIEEKQRRAANRKCNDSFVLLSGVWTTGSLGGAGMTPTPSIVVRCTVRRGAQCGC